MNWSRRYPRRLSSDSVHRSNTFREPGNESFFAPCAPYQEFLAYTNEITRVKFRLASPRAARRFRGAHARRMRIAMARVAAVDNRLRPISTGVKGQSARASGRQAGGDPVGREVGVADIRCLADLRPSGSRERSPGAGRLGGPNSYRQPRSLRVRPIPVDVRLSLRGGARKQDHQLHR